MAPPKSSNNHHHNNLDDEEDYEDSFALPTTPRMDNEDSVGGGGIHHRNRNGNRLQLEDSTGDGHHHDEGEESFELQEVDLVKSSNSSAANSREPLKDDITVEDSKNGKKKLSLSQIYSNIKSVLFTKAFLQTMLLNFSILCMCVSASSIGSLINVFSKQTSTERSEIGIVFTIRGIGALVTTLIGGFVMDAMKKFMDKKIKDHHKRTLYETLTNYTLIIVSILTMTLSSALMPFCSSLWSLCASFLLWGIGQGYLGICSQALLFGIWNEMKINVTPFSQLFHFSAGLGLFFGPFTVLVVNSILGIDNSQVVVPSEEDVPEVVNSVLSIFQNNNTNTIINNSTVNGNSTTQLAGFIEGTLISKSVLGTNFIVCLLYLFSVALFIIYMIYMWVKRNENSEDVKPINDNEEEEEEEDTTSVASVEHGKKETITTTTTTSKSEFLTKLFVTILVALSLLTYCMAEATYGNVIYSYLTSMELADDSEANMINSGYWLLFTIGRGIAIPISYFVPPFIMLLVDFIGITISIALFWIFSTNISVLWVSSLLFGLSIASVYPTTISIPSSVMNLKITGLMTSLMVLGGSGGAMSGPYITLALFKSFSPKVIFAVVTIAEVCLALVLISLFIFSLLYNRRRRQNILKKEQAATTTQESPVLALE